MESISNISRRGGARPGAGRPAGAIDGTVPLRKVRNDMERLERAGAIKPLIAHEILQHIADEYGIWKRLLYSEDDGIVLKAMMFLVQMRDGRPAQQINVTSQSLTFNVSDIDKARAIVREIRGESIPNLGMGEPPASQVPTGGPVTNSETGSIMLSGDEGGLKGGDR